MVEDVDENLWTNDRGVTALKDIVDKEMNEAAVCGDGCGRLDMFTGIVVEQLHVCWIVSVWGIVYLTDMAIR